MGLRTVRARSASGRLAVGEIGRVDHLYLRDRGREVALVVGDEPVGGHAHRGGQMGGVCGFEPVTGRQGGGKLGGRPVQGGRGLAGEFGHLPFGDRDQVCGCGARGCWGALFDPARLSAQLGVAEPEDPREWLRRLFENPPPTPQGQRLLRGLAGDLGRGTAGLVNALDPDVVTLGGLAGPLRSAAPRDFEQAFEAGLMRVHRRDAPEVVTGLADENEVLVGVALAAFDQVLDAPRLALWAGEAQ